MNKISYLFLFLFSFIILALSLRGIAGNPYASNINDQSWIQNGPFELSPERGRFALTYSLVENNSVFLSDQIGKFASPDVGILNNRYVSLFAPGTSLAVIPGYLLGKIFGTSQVGTYAVISFFALLNTLLIKMISRKLGASPAASTIAALVFIFATPAFAYAVNLYQHHITVFLLLLAIYCIQKFKSSLSFFTTLFLMSTAIIIDYPNFFLFIPLFLYSIGQMFFIKKIKEIVVVKWKPFYIISGFLAAIPLVLLLWFNHIAYGNIFQISGTLDTAKSVEYYQQKEEKVAWQFFESRNMLNGFYIHFISPDRGFLIFTPIILLGLPAIIKIFRSHRKFVRDIYAPLLIGIVGTNIVLYSMWGDPWGGWAFGSRYLIPSYAIMAIFLGLTLTWWKKSIFLFLIFSILALYSISINTAGALTSSANPPQIEVLYLEKISKKEQKYTYQKNFDLLNINRSKSFVFQQFAKPFINSWQYYYLIAGITIFTILGWTIYCSFFEND